MTRVPPASVNRQYATDVGACCGLWSADLEATVGVSEVIVGFLVTIAVVITVYREWSRPEDARAGPGRWHSVALTLMTGGAAAIFFDRVDDQYGLATRVGILAIASGFVIELVQYLIHRKSQQ